MRCWAELQTPRRFPPPWEVHETKSFCIRHAKVQALPHLYLVEDETGRRMAMNRLTREEARRSTANKPSCRPMTLSPEPNESTERCTQPCAGGQKRGYDFVPEPIRSKCR
jgi:hypothetical protein